MKSTILVILFSAFAVCANASESAAEQGAAATVHALYDGFAAGDIVAVTGLMSPDIIWNEAESNPYADGNPYVGPDAVLAGVFARLGAEWTGFAATPEEFIVDGERVVALGRYTGAYNETGKSLDVPFVHVFTVENGKITHFQQYTDTARMLTVMNGE